MSFQNQKKCCLDRIDKSKKGSIDEDILELVNAINKKQQFYTTSSCSGRIMLISTPKSKKKNEYKWLFTTHKQADKKELKEAINNTNKQEEKEEEVWLKQESFIIHICCETITHAEDLLQKARALGLKRSGIISASKRIIVELIGTENLNCLIIKNKKVVVQEEYLDIIITEANDRMKRNKEKIDKFCRLISSE